MTFFGKCKTKSCRNSHKRGLLEKSPYPWAMAKIPQKYKCEFSCRLTLPSKSISQIFYDTILLQEHCCTIIVKYWIMVLSKGKSLLEGTYWVIKVPVIKKSLLYVLIPKNKAFYFYLTNDLLFHRMMEYF